MSLRTKMKTTMNNVLKPNLKTIRARLLPLGQVPPSMEIPVPLYISSLLTIAEMKLPPSESYPFKISEQVQALMNRRAEIERDVYPINPGEAGQIVCVESLLHEDLRSGKAVLPSPTYVLLDKPKFDPSEIDIPELYKYASNVWQGWMVCPDSDYMNEWDVLLNDQSLREDFCQFVQTWNRVEVYLPTVHRVAGFVEDSLLKNIRYLSLQFSIGQDDLTISETIAPSQLVQRQLPFGWVCTGTFQNESDKTDPRNSYVQMYGQYSALFSDAVWSMLHDLELEYALIDSTYKKSSFTVNSVIVKLLNLINNTGNTPQKAGAGALTLAKNLRNVTLTTQPRFILEWAQNELTWRMEGWRHGEEEEVLLFPQAHAGVIPTVILWQSVNNMENQRFNVSLNTNGKLSIDIKLIKVMRRIEKLENALKNKVSSDLLAEMLPVILP